MEQLAYAQQTFGSRFCICQVVKERPIHSIGTQGTQTFDKSLFKKQKCHLSDEM